MYQMSKAIQSLNILKMQIKKIHTSEANIAYHVEKILTQKGSVISICPHVRENGNFSGDYLIVYSV